MTRVIGIDPGLQIAGYGIIEVISNKLIAVAGGTIKPKAKDLPNRLLEIHDSLYVILKEYMPDAASVEDLYTTYTHPKTAVLMGHARGTSIYTIAEAGVPVFNYTPTEVKSAVTGYGRASKEQMQNMITKLLNLKEPPKYDHISDAFGMAICHINRERTNTLQQGRRIISR